LSSTRSDIINTISKNFPNLLKKDIIRFVDIFVSEIIKALKNNERVELRDVMIFETKTQKKRISLNPKTFINISVPEKKSIIFRSSKEWKKKLNEKI